MPTVNETYDIQIKAKLDKAMSGLNKMNLRIKKIGASAKKAGRAMSKMGRNITVGLAAAGYATKKLLDDMDKIIKTSRDLSISTDAWQTLSFAFEQMGISTDVAKKAVFNLQKTIGKAGRGEKIYEKALNDIGLSYDTLKTKSPDKQLQLVIDALRDVEDPAKRAAIANDLLGRAAKDMGSAYEAGSKGIAELRKEAIEYGLVIDKDVLKQSEATNDALNLLWRTFKAGISRIVGSSDAIEKFAKSMAKFIAKLPAQITIFKQQWKNFTEGNGENPFIKLGDKLQAAIKDTIDKIIGWFNDTMTKIDWSQLGKDMSTSLSGAISGLADSFSNINFEELGKSLVEFLKGIEWVEVANSLFNAIKAVLNGLGSFLVGIIKEAFSGITDWIPFVGGEKKTSTTGRSVRATNKASGGPVLGKGSGTSDSIMARLSNGEFVVNAKATKKNYGLLDAINKGIPGFAAGGGVNINRGGLSAATGIVDPAMLDYIINNGGYALETLVNSFIALTDAGQNADIIVEAITGKTTTLTESYKNQSEAADKATESVDGLSSKLDKAFQGQVNDSFKSGIKNVFKTALRGGDVGEAFKNMMLSIADKFIDRAIDQMFEGLDFDLFGDNNTGDSLATTGAVPNTASTVATSSTASTGATGATGATDATALASALTSAGTTFSTAITNAGTTVSTAITNAGTTVSTSLETAATTAGNTFTTSGTTLSDTMRTAGDTISRAIKTAGDSAASAIRSAASSGGGGLGGGLGGGGGGSIFGGLFGFSSGGIVPRPGQRPQYFANGGMAKGTDTIPAMLTPGEMVLTKEQQGMLGGSTNIYYNISAMDSQSFDQRWFESLAKDPKRVSQVNVVGKKATSGIRRR